MTVAKYFEGHHNEMDGFEFCDLIREEGKGDANLDHEGDTYIMTVYTEVDDSIREQSFAGDADIEVAVEAFLDAICCSAADRGQIIRKWKRENGLEV